MTPPRAALTALTAALLAFLWLYAAQVRQHVYAGLVLLALSPWFSTKTVE